MDKRLVLGILVVALVGIATRVVYTALKSHRGGAAAQRAYDEQMLLPLRTSFDPRHIAATCANTRVGRLFEDCYSPRMRALESQAAFGPVGIALKATIGFEVLNQDYHDLKSSGKLRSTLHGDFLALGLTLSTLREIQNHQAREGLEKSQQVQLFAKMANMYVDLRGRITGQLSRAPAQAGSYQNTLTQYDSAYQQLADHR